jgi:hypothetical protein
VAICRVSLQILHLRCRRMPAAREPQTGRGRARTVPLKARWRAARDCAIPSLEWSVWNRVEARAARPRDAGQHEASTTCSTTASRTRASEADGATRFSVRSDGARPLDAESRQPSATGRRFIHAPSPTPRNHAADRVGAGERIPEVTQRAARPIRHHAGRPLEFRVRPRA